MYTRAVLALCLSVYVCFYIILCGSICVSVYMLCVYVCVHACECIRLHTYACMCLFVCVSVRMHMTGLCGEFLTRQIFEKHCLSEDLKQYFQKQSKDLTSSHYKSVFQKCTFENDYSAFRNF